MLTLPNLWANVSHSISHAFALKVALMNMKFSLQLQKTQTQPLLFQQL